MSSDGDSINATSGYAKFLLGIPESERTAFRIVLDLLSDAVYIKHFKEI